MLRPIFALTALTLSAGLATAQTETPEDHCGAAGLQGLVGQTGEIAHMLILEAPKRVIEPGSLVTTDFRQERINFLIDEDGMIEQVSCG